MTEPTILIHFNPETWTPAAIFYNGATDLETAKLRKIADMMLKAAKANAMKKLWVILKQIPMRFRLRRLERKITPIFNRDLSLKIDQALNRLEGSRP